MPTKHTNNTKREGINVREVFTRPVKDHAPVTIKTAVETEEENRNHGWTQINTDFAGEDPFPAG